MTADITNEPWTRELIAIAIKVHQTLGTGYKENIYKQAFKVELRRRNIPFEAEKEVFIYYEGVCVGKHILDLYVANEIVLELKYAVTVIPPHYAQIRSYMKATNARAGLLINFCGTKADFRLVTADPNR